MLYFDTDYMRGAHPEVMKRLVETNMQQTTGYGTDEYTARAKQLICEVCEIAPEQAMVFFLEGGTQTNAVAIDALLRHSQGVLCADTAHINVHEAGAIECSGHKVIALPSEQGKLQASQIREYMLEYRADPTYQHIVEPKMVYISFPTEFGTLYTLEELREISETCRSLGLYLYLDGARLFYGLAAVGNNVTLPDIARLCDLFYIGGTKAGALFGEALVCADARLLPRFFSLVKQHGALQAKGRLLGVQFETLFTNELYRMIGEQGVTQAAALTEVMTKHGFEIYMDSTTNQRFFVIPNDVMDTLAHYVSFEIWGTRGRKVTVVRFVTDWGTTAEDIVMLDKCLQACKK